MTKYDIQIFAEIVDASTMTIEAILERAEDYSHKGADVIDLGCLPDTPFPHLEEAVGALKEHGYKSSVNSADPDELLRGGKAGADYLLSLNEETLHIADKVASTPVLIPKDHGDMASLYRAMDALDAKGRAYLADPVLDPINFGFMTSLERYARTSARAAQCRDAARHRQSHRAHRRRHHGDHRHAARHRLGAAHQECARGAGEPPYQAHLRRARHRAAHDVCFARRRTSCPRATPTSCSASMRAGRFPLTPEEIAEAAAEVRDKNFRIEIAEDGIHIFNRDGHHVAQDAFELFAKLGVDEDGPHAFYLGAELARAEIAWRLGKRYAQDEPLAWGVAADAPADDRTRLKEAGHTLIAKKKRQAS